MAATFSQTPELRKDGFDALFLRAGVISSGSVFQT